MRTTTLEIALAWLAGLSAAAAAPPSPTEFLGHAPGADYKLAGWQKIQNYCRLVARESDRVRIEDVGRSSLGRAMIVAVISSPENLKELEKHRRQQQQMADPRRVSDSAVRARLAEESRIVVLVNCGMHSTECMSTQTAVELLYTLATGTSPQVREILQKAIVLLVPSANPDGTDLVTEWYYRTLGKPWEGDGMPWLYHTYAGHDNNRDWFALHLAETRNLSRVLYQEWFPTIVLDLHQQGGNSARIVLPPYHNPINPNIPTLVSQAQLILGGLMATDLSRAGKTGAAYGVTYDLWYHGAFRSTPNRHNMIGILTETASARLATPVFLRKDELRGAGRGLPSYAAAVNFSDPWPGGWWRPADIVQYQMIVTMSLLSAAARHHELFQSNHSQMASEAIQRGRRGLPMAWIVPADQPDRGAVAQMLRSLHGTGVEVRRAQQPFTADRTSYPAGTYLLDCAQPYEPHLRDMMERQVYPDQTGESGKPETPYDIAGWTLPFQMGVRAAPAGTPVEVRSEKLDGIGPEQCAFSGPQAPAGYLLRPAANDDFRLVNRLHNRGIKFSMLLKPVASPDAPSGSLIIACSETFKASRRQLLEGLALNLFGLSQVQFDKLAAAAVPAVQPRLVLYQPWLPSMDEGWTRLVLERFEIPYASLHNADVLAGSLRGKYDCIVLPSISASHILNGYARDATEPQYVGGIGADGARALQEFVHEGGTLACIDASCELPIKYFGIPVRSALVEEPSGRPLDSSHFYCPGSILGVTLDTSHPIAWGKPARISGYFINSQAFELRADSAKDASSARHYSARVVARYADSLLLESGYLLGPEHLADKPAIVEVSYGKGRIVLFGFRVQHRCQTWGTFRLLFNAIQSSTIGPQP